MAATQLTSTTFTFQLLFGEIHTGAIATSAGTGGAIAFRNTGSDLFYRTTPWLPGEEYRLGQPWPVGDFEVNGVNGEPRMLPTEWRQAQWGFVYAAGGAPPPATARTRAFLIG